MHANKGNMWWGEGTGRKGDEFELCHLGKGAKSAGYDMAVV
jgi:hypothetical protein